MLRCATTNTPFISPKNHVIPPREFSLPGVNPLTPMSDQDRISPYKINTISTR